jgi:hypothetical protein
MFENQLTAMSLTGMTPKGILDVENVTKEQCIAAIRDSLDADDGNLDEDAEKIYQYFSSLSKNFLIYEFVLSLSDDQSYDFDGLAAELE